MNSTVLSVNYLSTRQFLESKAAIDADSEAKSLFDDYIAFQGKIQQLMQTGQMPTPELQEEMKSFGEKNPSQCNCD